MSQECERLRLPAAPFMLSLPAPARRALEQAGVSSLQILSRWRRQDVLALHGIGKRALSKLEKALAEAGLSFSR